jgi:hypothetical protein
MKTALVIAKFPKTNNALLDREKWQDFLTYVSKSKEKPIEGLEEISENVWQIGVTSFKIIGLVSSFVPFQEEWENKTYRYTYVGISNSGYTVIVPIDAVLELVWK